MKRIFKKSHEFNAHEDDRDGVAGLSNLRCYYRLTPQGHVWSVDCGRDFADAHIAELIKLPKLIAVTIVQAAVGFTEVGFRQLMAHPSLYGFGFVGDLQFTDECIAAVEASCSLRNLCLGDERIDDSRVKLLARSNRFFRLSLATADLTDACVPDLSTMTELRCLRVPDTKISEPAISQLAASLPKCTIVSSFGRFGKAR